MASNLVKEKEMQGITNKSNKTYVILSFEQLSQEVDTVAPTKNVNGVYIYIPCRNRISERSLCRPAAWVASLSFPLSFPP